MLIYSTDELTLKIIVMWRIAHVTAHLCLTRVEGTTWRVCEAALWLFRLRDIHRRVVYRSPSCPLCSLERASEGLIEHSGTLFGSKHSNLTPRVAGSYWPKAQATLPSSCGPVLSSSLYNNRTFLLSLALSVHLTPPHLHLRSRCLPVRQAKQ